eukprot:8912697-Pyramimonas_sp.AAC.1
MGDRGIEPFSRPPPLLFLFFLSVLVLFKPPPHPSSPSFSSHLGSTSFRTALAVWPSSFVAMALQGEIRAMGPQMFHPARWGKYSNARSMDRHMVSMRILAQELRPSASIERDLDAIQLGATR